MTIDNFRANKQIEKYSPKHDPYIDNVFGVWYSDSAGLACSTAPGRIWD